MNPETFVRKIQGYYCPKPEEAKMNSVLFEEIFLWAKDRKAGTLDDLWRRLVDTKSREYKYIPSVAELKKMWVDMSYEVPQIAPDAKQKLITDGARDYSKELGDFMRKLVSKTKLKEKSSEGSEQDNFRRQANQGAGTPVF